MKDEQKNNGSEKAVPKKSVLNSKTDKKSKSDSIALGALPQRYRIKGTSDSRILTCSEAPNISVYVEAGLTISESEARKSSPGTIYLDGAAQCEPFMDFEKQVYNFDHHEGCLRPFTLSTCEQVLVMIFKGLDLRDRDWRVFANDPDLDTVLAIWLLFNHVRLRQKDSDRLRLLYALVRLEGIIDTHGLEMILLSAFPPKFLNTIKKVIDFLRAEEIDLKKKEMWEKNDYLEYTAMILHKIDRVIYKSDDFNDFKELYEFARIEIGDHRIAVVVEAELGIYELEPHLNRLYGENLGLVILKKGEGFYTLRRMDPFLPLNLSDVYEELNSIDPSVSCRKNGSKWGGSDDIGGSPRGMPTKLTPKEILQACRDASQKNNFVDHTIHFFFALALVGIIVGAATICKFYFSSHFFSKNTTKTYFLFISELSFLTALTFFTASILIIFSRARWRRFGIRLPTGKSWWLLLPVVILSAFAKGVYVPQRILPMAGFDKTIVLMIITIALASELLFRSLAHGILIKGARTQTCRSEWFFSYPTVASASLYAAFIAYLVLLPNLLQGTFQMKVIVKCLFAAFAFGLAVGFVRERSQSVLPAILFHIIAITILVCFEFYVSG